MSQGDSRSHVEDVLTYEAPDSTSRVSKSCASPSMNAVGMYRTWYALPMGLLFIQGEDLVQAKPLIDRS